MPPRGPQLGVLLRRKIQPDSPSTFAEGGFDFPAPGNIQCEAAAFGDFPNLPIIGEVSLSGSGVFMSSSWNWQYQPFRNMNCM